MAMCKDSHVNARGNTRDRRARKLWMLAFFGNGTHAQCWECGATVDYETLVVDRIIPGKDGGRYTRDNIRPQCFDCCYQQGYAMGIGAKPGKFRSDVSLLMSGISA